MLQRVLIQVQEILLNFNSHLKFYMKIWKCHNKNLMKINSKNISKRLLKSIDNSNNNLISRSGKIKSIIVIKVKKDSQKNNINLLRLKQLEKLNKLVLFVAMTLRKVKELRNYPVDIFFTLTVLNPGCKRNTIAQIADLILNNISIKFQKKNQSKNLSMKIPIPAVPQFKLNDSLSLFYLSLPSGILTS